MVTVRVRPTTSAFRPRRVAWQHRPSRSRSPAPDTSRRQDRSAPGSGREGSAPITHGYPAVRGPPLVEHVAGDGADGVDPHPVAPTPIDHGLDERRRGGLEVPAVADLVAAEDEPGALGERGVEQGLEVGERLVVAVHTHQSGEIAAAERVGRDVVERTTCKEPVGDHRDVAAGVDAPADPGLPAGVGEGARVHAEDLADPTVGLGDVSGQVVDGEIFDGLTVLDPPEVPAARVEAGVVADLVAGGDHPPPTPRVSLRLAGHHEEGGGHPELVEGPPPDRYLRRPAVIEGEAEGGRTIVGPHVCISWTGLYAVASSLREKGDHGVGFSFLELERGVRRRPDLSSRAGAGPGVTSR